MDHGTSTASRQPPAASRRPRRHRLSRPTSAGDVWAQPRGWQLSL